MTQKRFLWVLAICLLYVSAPVLAPGQWISQHFTLHPGWNAVFVEGQPDPADCDVLFDGMPIESVWFFNNRVSYVQFTEDPNEMVAQSPEWMVYYPPRSQNRDATELYKLIGGRAYLIKVTGTESIEWSVTGSPIVPRHIWVADAKNFTGFPVDRENPPTFAKFFSSSAAHSGQPVYRLNQTTGKWEEVTDLATTNMRRGEAFWIQTKGVSTWQGPLRIESDFSDGLEFGRITSEISLEIENLTDETRTITFRTLASAEPTTCAFPAVAGDVPLSYFKVDLRAKKIDWLPLMDSYSIEAKPGEERVVRFKVRRKDLSPPLGGAEDPLYQSLLLISDDGGFVKILPVSTKTFLNSAILQRGRKGTIGALPDNMPYELRHGLWVGMAEVKAVCEVNSSSDPVSPRPTATAFSFPILVHLDVNDQARLLNEVYVMIKPAVKEDDPNNPGHTIVTEHEKMVLLTERSLTSRYEGVRNIGGELVGRRISTAAFATSKPDATQEAAYHHTLVSTQFPVEMQPEAGATSPILTCTVVIDYDDPLNPFKDKYHPDHDNLTERFDAQLPEGKESYEVSRKVELEFSANDPYDRPAISDWGDTQVGGYYHEVITGVHRKTLYVRGRFYLKHLVNTDTLNDSGS